jgi:hypothetical protein
MRTAHSNESRTPRDVRLFKEMWLGSLVEPTLIVKAGNLLGQLIGGSLALFAFLSRPPPKLLGALDKHANCHPNVYILVENCYRARTPELPN